MVISFLIFYVVLFYKSSDELGSESGTPAGEGQVPAIEEGYQINPVTKEDCLAIEDQGERQDCLDNIVLDEAIDSNFFSKCNEIVKESTKNDCMHRIAHNQASIDLCLKIPDNEIKETCVGDVAISLKDPSVCSAAYKESFELKECRDVATAFLIGESGQRDDLNECAGIETKEYSNLCFMISFEAKYGGDCNKVPADYRQYCIDRKTTAEAEKIEDCDAVKDQNYKDYCLKVAKLGLAEARTVDSDSDGIADGNELFMKTDPAKPDTDGDGINDGAEWMITGTDPGESDTDSDGLSDSEELQNYKTDPKNPDTDGDGRSDEAEVSAKKNPLTKD